MTIELLTTKEVAHELRISPASLHHRSLRERLGLRAIRIGRLLRFRRQDVDAVIQHGLEQDTKEGTAMD